MFVTFALVLMIFAVVVVTFALVLVSFCSVRVIDRTPWTYTMQASRCGQNRKQRWRHSNTRALTVLSKAEEAASMLSPCPRGLSICSQHGKRSRVLSSLGMTDMTSRISSALQEDFTSHVCFCSEDAKSKVDARTFL